MMQEQTKVKAKGRKIGRGKRRNSRYVDRALKKRRLLKRMKANPRYKAPGWSYREGYGLVEER